MKILEKNPVEFKINIKREDINNYGEIFNDRALLNLRGEKFAYFMLKNKKVIDALYEDINKFNNDSFRRRGELSEEFIAIEKEIISKYCHKDKEGNPIIKNDSYVINNDDIEKLENEKREACKTSKELEENYNSSYLYNQTMQDYMKEEIEIYFHSIRRDNIPESISASELIKIEKFIQ